MKWKTWTRFTAVVFFIIAVLTFYFTYLDDGSAILSIENFPTETDLDTLDVNEDITFSFFLYNDGADAAIVQSVFIERLYEDGNSPTDVVIIEPSEDFTVESKSTTEIMVTLPAPEEATTYSLQAKVYTENEIIESEFIPVVWGTLA